jgi:Flp pilus assembly protein TadD
LLALAAEFLKTGRPADAVVPLREASLLEPGNPIIQHDLGLACLEIGRVADAIAAFQRAIASNPRYTDAHFRMGIALEKLSDLGGAILAYNRATELLPSLAEAWFRAGALVYTLGHRKEAIGCFRRAATTGRKNRFGRLGAARALLTEDRDDEAERVLRQALARDPADAMAYDLLGNLLAEYGRFEEAHDCFARAIALAPLMAGSYYDLVRCRTVTTADHDVLARMEAALATPGLDVGQRLRLHLALGKAADDLGDYALAMQHFDAADAVRRGSASFDSAAFDRQINRLIARCTGDLIARAGELGSGDATPVLIVGMPRSGTTLVEQIVSNHPEVAAGGELIFWNERGAAWDQAGPAGTAALFLAQAAADYLGLLCAISPKGCAGDRQDAVQLPLGRADPSRIPACDNHPLSPRRDRRGAVDPPDPFPPEHGVSDRR